MPRPFPGGDLLQTLDESLQRLRNEPIPVTVPHLETGDSVPVRLEYQNRGDLAGGHGPVPDSLRSVAGGPRDVLFLYNDDYMKAARDKAPDHRCLIPPHDRGRVPACLD